MSKFKKITFLIIFLGSSCAYYINKEKIKDVDYERASLNSVKYDEVATNVEVKSSVSSPPSFIAESYDYVEIDGHTRKRYFPLNIRIPLCGLRGIVTLEASDNSLAKNFLRACVDVRASINYINIPAFKVVDLIGDKLLVEFVEESDYLDRSEVPAEIDEPNLESPKSNFSSGARYLVNAIEVASLWTYRWDGAEIIVPSLVYDNCLLMKNEINNYLLCKKSFSYSGNDFCNAVYYHTKNAMGKLPFYDNEKKNSRFEFGIKLPSSIENGVTVNGYHAFKYSMGCGT